MAEQDLIKLNTENGHLICQGDWNISNIPKLKKQFKKLSLTKQAKIIIDGKSISKLDSAGAWLLNTWVKTLSKHHDVKLINFSEQQKKLLDFSEAETASEKKLPEIKELGWRAQLGKFSIEQADEFYQFVNFVGLLFFESIRVFRNPKLWRWNAIVSVINRTGTSALPIIALLSFMIGIVISYQMGNQLLKYGANVFIVDLLGLSVLREFGPLLTAIMVSGRTGSAFTAQLGIMKVNQEIDALDTMGITPAEILIIPRIIGLFIVIPLLTIWADIFGVFGGMLMAQNMLKITWTEFLIRFQHIVPLRALLIGLGKAPIFALVIASIGCFQGMAVRGSAESVGTRTTRSVVLAIFFIIILDAIFSVIFSKLKL